MDILTQNLLPKALKEKLIENKIKLFNGLEYSIKDIESMLEMYLGAGFRYSLNPKVGTVISGTLLGTIGKSILVDVGYKDFVHIDSNKDEFAYLEQMSKQSNDTVDVLITDVKSNPYSIKGSFAQLSKKDTFKELLDNADDDIIECYIKEWTPIGYNAELLFDNHVLPTFIPNTLAGMNKLSDPYSIVGKTLPVMIDHFSDEKNIFISSRKKYLVTLIPEALNEVECTDADGNPIKYTGTVTGTTPYGVYVEFKDCLTGMIHKSNFDNETLNRLSTIKPGEPIDFYVKEKIVTPIKGNDYEVDFKLFLTQTWRVTLWDTIKRYDVFEKTISSIKPIGAFIQLDDETVGLIQASEIQKHNKELKAGDKIKVKVSFINRLERKIFLTIEKK